MADAQSGGLLVPPDKRMEVEARLRRYAEQHFAGHYARLEIRFKGAFCYVDAYTEPVESPTWPPPDWPESREAYYERLRSTPTHLCRLRYFGGDRWSYGFYAYSSESYQPALFNSGSWFGTPEQALQICASVYLDD